MYIRFAATTAVKDALTELEANLGVPLRVVRARGVAGYTPGPWLQRQVDACPVDTIEAANEHGVTIAIWGTSSPQNRYEAPGVWPGEMWADDDLEPVHAELYDTPVPHPAFPDTADPLEIDGQLLGEIHPRALIFHANLEYLMTGAYTQRVLDVERVFGEPLRRSMDTNFIESMETRRRERERVRFKEWCLNTRNRALDGKRDEITEVEMAAATLVTQLANRQGRLREMRAEIDAIQASMQTSGDDYQAMFAKLEEHPRITELGFDSSNRLVIVTDQLTMSHPEFGSRTLGRFRIRVGLGGERSLHFANLDYPRNGRPHPHVPETGIACFGDFGQSVAKYLADVQLIGLFEMLVMFLESFTPGDDYGNFAALWYDRPDALEEEAQQDDTTNTEIPDDELAAA